MFLYISIDGALIKIYCVVFRCPNLTISNLNNNRTGKENLYKTFTQTHLHAASIIPDEGQCLAATRKVVCEHDRDWIMCPEGTTIRIRDADYGRVDNQLCQNGLYEPDGKEMNPAEPCTLDVKAEIDSRCGIAGGVCSTEFDKR